MEGDGGVERLPVGRLRERAGSAGRGRALGGPDSSPQYLQGGYVFAVVCGGRTGGNGCKF